MRCGLILSIVACAFGMAAATPGGETPVVDVVCSIHPASERNATVVCTISSPEHFRFTEISIDQSAAVGGVRTITGVYFPGRLSTSWLDTELDLDIDNVRGCAWTETTADGMMLCMGAPESRQRLAGIAFAPIGASWATVHFVRSMGAGPAPRGVGPRKAPSSADNLDNAQVPQLTPQVG